MANSGEPAQWLTPTRGAVTLPAIEILTGRGFITGKSGSGKSNTASVILEELLDNSYDFLIVDPEGEYYGLKEQYDILHVGADEDVCDAQIGPEDAEYIAEIALTEDKPVILDVSDFLDGDLAKEIIQSVVRELFVQEKAAQKPFLLVVEEMQEYLPQSGKSGELAELLTRVAKRGRKRGLGMLGLSQRPQAVDKDFITQCDWLVWHRLTWQNDLDVVKNILGSETAAEVEQLETGEAFLMMDWEESTERVKFREKRTRDVGATPSLDSYTNGSTSPTSGAAPPPTDADPIADLAPSPDATPTDGDAQPAPDATHPESISDAPATDSASGVPASELGGGAPPSDPDELTAENKQLKAEVRELRRILRDAQQSETNYAGERTPVDFSTETSTSDTSTVSSPSRPTAPNRPKDRSGFAGAIIEFTELAVYLVALVVYLFRLFFYHLRTGGDRSTGS